MTSYDNKIITCKKCGRRFTWTAGEQRYYQRHGLDDPLYCENCKAIRRDYFRSSQVDHPAAAPPAFPPPTIHQPPAPKPLPQPAPPKRPSWWSQPSNQYTALLWIFSILAVIILITLLFNIF